MIRALEVRTMGGFHSELPPRGFKDGGGLVRRHTRPRPAIEVEAILNGRRDAQPLVARCWFPGCEAWSFAGTAAECRQAAAEHRRELHPRAATRRRRRRDREPGSGLGPKPMYRQALEDQQAARARGGRASAAARRKKART